MHSAWCLLWAPPRPPLRAPSARGSGTTLFAVEVTLCKQTATSLRQVRSCGEAYVRSRRRQCIRSEKIFESTAPLARRNPLVGRPLGTCQAQSAEQQQQSWKFWVISRSNPQEEVSNEESAVPGIGFRGEPVTMPRNRKYHLQIDRPKMLALPDMTDRREKPRTTPRRVLRPVYLF